MSLNFNGGITMNDENEKDEEFEDLKMKSGGSSSSQKKRFFEDVTFKHKCKLAGKD